MKSKKQLISVVLCTAAMAMLILDAKTALTGAKEGVTLCLYTVIPSLFPFLFISGMLSSILVGLNVPFLRPLGKLCGIPSGGEPLLLLGLTGGYPVGAQNITHAYNNGQIKADDARRLLGFCNNAGPAFIFGLLSSLFKSAIVPWALWLIHITSAIIVGILLPGKSNEKCSLPQKETPTIAKALTNSIKIMGEICGWIILFRIFLSMLHRWLLWALPQNISIVLYGLSELTNGCLALYDNQRYALKFILVSVFLNFGGLCIAMQTVSVTKTLGSGYYFPGKTLQSIISLFLSAIIQWFLFPASECVTIPVFYICAAICIIIGLLLLLYVNKKIVEIPQLI